MDFLTLKKNLKKDFSRLKKVRLALLGDSATQLFAQAIRGAGFEWGLDLEVFEADYNQIDRNIFSPPPELLAFKPEFLLVFESAPKLFKEFCSRGRGQHRSFAQELLEKAKNRLEAASPLGCKVIVCNIAESSDAVFGNYANKTDASFLWQVRRFNLGLMELAAGAKNLFVLDVCGLQAWHGSRQAFDPKMYATADMVFGLDFLPLAAENAVHVIRAVTGRFMKCLILDLDNTLWGGVIGDDGLENIQVGDLGLGKVYTELQLWCKQLKERGIILAVCSQNEESIAKEPFEKHPEMSLRLEDIAVFVANRNSKVDNIKYIQGILNIGFDSMVFLDDNPFERNLVRTYLPEVTVPELPEDPAEYLVYLRGLNLFETASYVEEDGERTRQYQEEARRHVAMQSFAGEEEFLASLEMVSRVGPFEPFTLPRVAQLTQRSNQFNLRTIRYTEKDLEGMVQSGNFLTFSFTLEDKFGESGLISALILKKEGRDLFVDTWVMSCRVLKRGMEDFILNTLVGCAREHGFERLIGEYIPTKKNGLVKDLYRNLGFIQRENLWILPVTGHKMGDNFIRRVSHNGNE